MTTYHEWLETGKRFHLHGGPCDGQTVDPRLYVAWPSFIKVEGHRYRMRIGGPLDAYDFDGSDESQRDH